MKVLAACSFLIVLVITTIQAGLIPTTALLRTSGLDSPYIQRVGNGFAYSTFTRGHHAFAPISFQQFQHQPVAAYTPFSHYAPIIASPITYYTPSLVAPPAYFGTHQFVASHPFGASFLPGVGVQTLPVLPGVSGVEATPTVPAVEEAPIETEHKEEQPANDTETVAASADDDDSVTIESA